MAWTDPPTFVDGVALPASQLNQYVRDNLNYLKGISDGVTASGVQVHRNANQSINDSTPTAISFDGEDYDFGGWWSSGTTITVPAGAIPAGYTSILLICVLKVYFAADADGYRRVIMLKNGGSFAQATEGANAAAVDKTLTDFVQVVAGDTITLQVEHTAGAAINITAGFTVMRYAPAS